MLEAPRLPVPPTARQRATAALFFLLTAALWGCPSTDLAGIRIISVEVEGDAASTAFDLVVEGQGFGLTAVRYDVADGTGTSSVADLSFRIASRSGTNARVLPRSALTVQSPRRMRVAVRLDTALPPGIYGVELYDGMERLAVEEVAFEVEGAAPADGGVPVEDAGAADAGTPDAGPPPDGGPRDAGVPDTGVVDAGVPDSGVPDSGLGPFVGGFRYRRPVDVQNAVDAPAGATVRVPVPHEQWVNAGRMSGDARDLEVYQGGARLDFQWGDRFAVGTDALELVVRLAQPVVAGVPADLVLYYGDPTAQNAPTDAVFAFVERFTQPVAPVDAGNDGAWFQADAWIHCNADRPLEVALDPAIRQSYCVLDRFGGLARSTLATPRQAAISNQPGPGLTYEMSLWWAGRMPDGAEDVLYPSYGPNNDQFDITTDLPPAAWTGFVPAQTVRFRDVDDQDRTVTGWGFPAGQIQWWQRAVARFTPAVDRPSLHFRFVSTDNESADGAVLLDDWWVRLALDPAPAVVLGPEEVRP